MSRRKYRTPEESKAAARAQQAAYRAARKAGTWVRKNRILSKRIAAKAGVEVGFDPKAAKVEAVARGAAKRRHVPASVGERAKRREEIKEKYGFDIWTPVKKLTPEELEGRRRWLRDEEAEYRNLNREHITIYNREYRRRKRAEALAIKQKTWTAEEWARWRAKEESKGRGNPDRFVKEVVKLLAESGKISEDEVTTHLLENGGIEFLASGAEAIGRIRARRPAMVKAAAMAVAFYIDPDGAVMFPEE